MLCACVCGSLHRPIDEGARGHEVGQHAAKAYRTWSTTEQRISFQTGILVLGVPPSDCQPARCHCGLTASAVSTVGRAVLRARRQQHGRAIACARRSIRGPQKFSARLRRALTICAPRELSAALHVALPAADFCDFCRFWHAVGRSAWGSKWTFFWTLYQRIDRSPRVLSACKVSQIVLHTEEVLLNSRFRTVRLHATCTHSAPFYIDVVTAAGTGPDTQPVISYQKCTDLTWTCTCTILPVTLAVLCSGVACSGVARRSVVVRAVSGRLQR